MSEETQVVETPAETPKERKRAEKIPVAVYKTEQEARDGEQALKTSRRIYKVVVLGETRFVAAPTPVLATGFAVRDVAGAQITCECINEQKMSPVTKRVNSVVKNMSPEELNAYIAELQKKVSQAA